MDFIISDKIFERHPDYLCAVVIVNNCSNVSVSDDISSKIREAQQKIREEVKLEGLAQEPFIRNWRNAYSKFGAEPSRYKASSEALIRRTLKGEPVPRINPLVDIYNYISLKYRTPVGGEDLLKVVNPIQLRFADGSERFVKLGNESEDSIEPGEVVYADGSNNILCRRWNWRESEATKLTENTRDAILEADFLLPLTEQVAREATGEMVLLVKAACGADVREFLMSGKNRQIEF